MSQVQAAETTQLLRAWTNSPRLIYGLDEVPHGVRLYVFGAGRAGEALAEGLASLTGAVVAGVIDNFRTGAIGVLPILSWRAFLDHHAEGSLVLLASQYYEEILAGLDRFPRARLYNAYPLARVLMAQREVAVAAEQRYRDLNDRYEQAMAQDRERVAWTHRIVHQYRSHVEAAEWQVRALQSEHFGPAAVESKPLAKIPNELIDGYTMGGTADLSLEYDDGSYPANHPLIYTDEEVDAYLAKIARGETYYYVETDKWLRVALDRYDLAGKAVAVVGSRAPWFESVCLSRGANPVTIDYNPILLRSTRLASMTVAEWEQTRPQFEVALAISAIEHSGLGRYGDPLDPDGDVRAMQRLKEIVTPGGVLFFSVPVGRDETVFNLHRRYGPHRLPRLLTGWKEVDVIGWNRRFERYEGPEPVFILQNC